MSRSRLRNIEVEATMVEVSLAMMKGHATALDLFRELGPLFGVQFKEENVQDFYSEFLGRTLKRNLER